MDARGVVEDQMNCSPLAGWVPLFVIRFCVTLGLLCFLMAAAFGADEPLSKREKTINDTRAWLTNEFTPWLTNAFPDVTIKVYPEWFVNPPSRTRLPTWLTNTFLKI